MDLSLYDSTYRVEDTHWWFAGRRAVVFDELRRRLAAAPDSGDRPRVLDLGCGTGRNLVELQRLGEAFGLDIEAKALEYCRRRGMRSVAQARAEDLPFRDESFDVVTALDLLEHLDDDVAGAREIYRVLRPGGTFLAFVPAYRWLWGPQDEVSHHRRRYTPRRLASAVRRAGLRIRRLTHANLFLLPLILAGRTYLRASGRQVASENGLHPGWVNPILKAIFTSERHVLRRADLPLGVSILCVATKDGVATGTGRAEPTFSAAGG